MTYEEFQWAKQILGISLPSTYKKIKKKHNELIKKFHPDISGLDKEEAIKKSAEINKAYEIIKEYCENYKMDFSEEEFYKQRPEARLAKRYSDDPIWH